MRHVWALITHELVGPTTAVHPRTDQLNKGGVGRPSYAGDVIPESA